MTRLRSSVWALHGVLGILLLSFAAAALEVLAGDFPTMSLSDTLTPALCGDEL